MGDGQVRTACVAFTEPAISGLALLERSGLDIVAQTSAGNAAVCSIAGQGCRFPRQACFCQCQGGGTCRYWAYWHLVGGVWQYASTGAATYRVPPGGVDGWAWGDGNVNRGSRPPDVSFEDICPALRPASPKPTATRPKTAATRPRPTATRSRSTTSRPAPTATRTASAKAQPTTRRPARTPTTHVPATPTTSQASGTIWPAGGSTAADYLLFGGMVGMLLTAIGLASRRRR